MARKKTAKAPDKAVGDNGVIDEGKFGRDASIVQGVWGLIYFSTGALLLISMLFYSPAQHAGAGSPTHILGQYLGTSLAMGVFYLFGRVTGFMFPLAVGYIGIAKLTNRRLHLKWLLFLVLLTLELCVLLAVGHMSALAENGLAAAANAAGSNFIGLFVVSGLVPLFSARTFGPYFIVSLLMAITVVIGLRIRPQSVVAFLSSVIKSLMRLFGKAVSEVKVGIENSPDIVLPSVNNNGGAETHPLSASKKKSAAASDDPANSANGDTADETAEAALNKCGVDDNNEDTAGVNVSEKDLADALGGMVIEGIETEDIDSEEDDDGIPPFDLDDDGDDREDGNNDDDSEVNGNDDNDGGDPPAPPVKPYILPAPEELTNPPPIADLYDKAVIERTSMTLMKTLMHFKVGGKVARVSPGPVVTRYEIVLDPGVKVSKVTGLQDDLMMAVGAEAIRIQAPIPGKSAVGIELPNEKRQNVHFKHILLSDEFKKFYAPPENSADEKSAAAQSEDWCKIKNNSLPVIVGSNISGLPYVTDITKTPHLLVAGQTGSGKSVCMNSLICTMLMTKKPDELRLIMVDPKQVEFAPYENIPHLLSPIVTESKEAVKALQWSVMEMERRYRLLMAAGVRKIDDFNTKVGSGKLTGILPEEDNKLMPHIVIIIDELADLMMTAPKDVEGLIARITQKARAAGIHMIIATQRPSVNVITGIIKANLPSRIAFRTVSQIDSRTILDQSGSEKLLGLGDMLFLRNGAPSVERFHGAFIPDEDVESIVSAIKKQQVELETVDFSEEIPDMDDGGSGGEGESGRGGGKRDDLFAEAAKTVVSLGIGSTSLLQRQMEIGFARAGRIMDQLERAGIVGPPKGSKPREVFVRPEDLEAFL